MKATPWKLIQAHYRTLRDARTDEARWQDYALFIGVPAVVLVTCALIGVKLPHGASAGLLTATGVLTAFFFGVMLQIAERAMDWADNAPEPGKQTTWQVNFLKQIAANAGYACLISIAAAAVFVVALVAKSSLLLIASSSVGLALAVHLALLLSMVLNRVYALITRRLKSALVGGPKGTVHHLHEHNTGSGTS